MNTENLLKIAEQIAVSSAPDSSFQADSETPFPVHLLPQDIRGVLEALAHAYKAPRDLIACMQLGILSSCLGKGIYLVSNHPDPTYGLLYQFVATLPGVNKSTVLKWLSRPLKRIQLDARKKQRIEVEAMLARNSKNGDSPPTSKAVSAEIGKACPTLVVEHSTQEGLATTLSHNNEYLGVISSDCSGVVDDLKGSKSNGSFQGELFLKGYSGDSYDTNFKVAADEHLEEVRLSLLWAGTVETLRDFISDPRISSRGLLSRFLFSEIYEPISRRDIHPRGISSEVESSWATLIESLLTHFWQADCPSKVVMSQEAIIRVVEFDNERIDAQHELNHCCALPERWAENGLRLALVLHCSRYGQKAPDHELSCETMEAALTILKWFIGRELDVLESYQDQDPITELVKSKVFEFLVKNGPSSTRELSRKTGLNKKFRPLLQQWVNAGELECWNASKGPRESIHYAIPGDNRASTNKQTNK